MAKEKKPERRRFEDPERKPWTEDERKKFLEQSEKLKPYIRHLTTPAKENKPKKRDPLDEFLGITEEE